MQETRQIFLSQWAELRSKGQEQFCDELIEFDAKKEKQRQMFRKLTLHY